MFFNANALPCITIGVDVWGESGIMTGVYLRWCSSALHVGTGSVLGSMSSSHLMMMMLFIGTHSVTTTLNVHSRSRSFVSAIDLRGLAPSMRLFRRPNTDGMKK